MKRLKGRGIGGVFEMVVVLLYVLISGIADAIERYVEMETHARPERYLIEESYPVPETECTVLPTRHDRNVQI